MAIEYKTTEIPINAVSIIAVDSPYPHVRAVAILGEETFRPLSGPLFYDRALQAVTELGDGYMVGPSLNFVASAPGRPVVFDAIVRSFGSEPKAKIRFPMASIWRRGALNE